jgi:hypothetical protein
MVSVSYHRILQIDVLLRYNKDLNDFISANMFKKMKKFNIQICAM